jgi:hypothetical protein
MLWFVIHRDCDADAMKMRARSRHATEYAFSHSELFFTNFAAGRHVDHRKISSRI